jgi:cell division control protein 45
MVYIPPPQIANGTRPSYAETYSRIVSTFRSSPLTSASSIIILVAPDVDALCAARMLSDLFNQDDVIHRIIPVSGFSELEAVRGELSKYAEVRLTCMISHTRSEPIELATHPHLA